MPDVTTHGASANAGAAAKKPWPETGIDWQDPEVQNRWVSVPKDKIGNWKDVARVMNNWTAYVLAHQREMGLHSHDDTGAIVYPPGGRHPPPDPPFGG